MGSAIEFHCPSSGCPLSSCPTLSPSPPLGSWPYPSYCSLLSFFWSAPISPRYGPDWPSYCLHASVAAVAMLAAWPQAKTQVCLCKTNPPYLQAGFCLYLCNICCFFVSSLSFSEKCHVGSLFINEEQTTLGLWRKVHFCHTRWPRSQRHRLCQNGSAHGWVFGTFKRWFVTKLIINRVKIAFVHIFIIPFLQTDPVMQLRWGSRLKLASEQRRRGFSILFWNSCSLSVCLLRVCPPKKKRHPK